MSEKGDRLRKHGHSISAFLEYIKCNDNETLDKAKDTLREIKSYSSTQKDGKGYRIRIKCKDEERIYNYSFSSVYGEFLSWVCENSDLNSGRTFYIENTGGFILNYMGQRGFDSIGYAMTPELWETSIFSNFPVYRREYMRKPIPEITFQLSEVNASRVVWISLDRGRELEVIKRISGHKSKDIFILALDSEDLGEMGLNGEVILQEHMEIEKTKYKFVLISNSKGIEKKGTYLPEGMEVLEGKSSIFRIQMDKCRDNNGFSYKEKGHYFVETLKQYQKNKDLQYKESYLYEYYEGFQPRNRRENYLWEDSVCCFPLSSGWLYDPWRKPANPYLRENRFQTRKGGNHNFGPNSDGFGEAEFKRLVNAYGAIEKYGYRPDFFVDGYITGYLLIGKDDYRFIVSEGQHRIAALAALGYQRFLGRLDMKPQTNQRVFHDKASGWPQVEAGIFTQRVAKMCFEHFFRSDNNTRLVEHLNRSVKIIKMDGAENGEYY